METGSEKLKKLRTFSDDMEQVKGGNHPNLPKVELPAKSREPDIKENRAEAPAPTQRAHPLPPPPELPNTKHHATYAPQQTEAEAVPKTTKIDLAQKDNEARETRPASVSNTNSNISPSLRSSFQKETHILTNEDALDVMDSENELMEGSIITDKKRERFRLLPAIWQGLSSWFKTEKTELENLAQKRRDAVPKVRSIEERKEIIERAAKGSTLATKHEHLHIKKPDKAKEEAAVAPVSLKKKSEASKPGWSHFAGKGEPKEETTTNTTPNVETPATTPPTEVRPPTTSPIQISMTAPTITPSAPEKEAAPTPVIHKDEPVSTPIPIPSLKPEVARPREAKKKSRSIKKEAGNVFSLWRVGAVGTLSVVLGVSLTLWIFNGLVSNQEETPVVRTLPTDNTPIEGATQKPVIISLSSATFQDELLSTRTTEAKLVNVVPLDTSRRNDPADTERILAALNPDAPSIFLHTINSISLAWWRGEPVIILRTNSFDNAFGGILEWEGNMSSDLSPWFGEVVTSTFDPRSTTEDKTVQPFFADQLVDNLDVRVLRDDLQKERITYGFKGRNMIIITTNRETFAAVAELVK